MAAVSQEYVNEIIGALESQRNQALKQAAELQATASLQSKVIAALIKVIKDKGLEEHFSAVLPKDPPKDADS